MWNQNFYYERRAFGAAHSVVPWGPGFARFVREATAADVWRDFGPFDLVIQSEFFLYTAPLLGVADLPCPKAAVLCDAYTNGIQFHRKVWQRDGVSIVLHRYTNMLDQWVAACPSIAFFHQPWAVDASVYKADWTPLRRRGYDVAFLGNSSPHLYPVRHALKPALLAARDLRLLSPPHPGGIRYGNKLPRNTDSVIGERYAAAYASASIGIATGGKPSFLVGKYFEIPGCATALLATPAEDMESQGFVPDQNMVLLDTVQPIAQIRALLSRPDDLAAIADAGYSLIRARHLWSHRVRRFTQWFEAKYGDTRHDS